MNTGVRVVGLLEVINNLSLPLVSVAIPCYNHDKYVADCIKSVIAQDYQNIELIIIDDGSTDSSVEEINELMAACKQRFVRFEFRWRSNKGLCATLNEAIEWCGGEFYSAIASDDMMLPHKISRQIQYLAENPGCDAIFGGANIIDDSGKIIRRKKSKKGVFGFEDLFLVKRSVSTPTQMIRLSCLRAAGKYPVGHYIEDWYMWLRMAAQGARLDDLGDILVSYRKHDSNISGDLEKMNAARIRIIDMYKDHPLYERAKATSQLSAAMDMQALSKIASIKFICRAVTKSHTIFFDRRFYRYLFKFLLPAKFIGRKNG